MNSTNQNMKRTGQKDKLGEVDSSNEANMQRIMTLQEKKEKIIYHKLKYIITDYIRSTSYYYFKLDDLVQLCII